jgi:hypothetical protein
MGVVARQHTMFFQNTISCPSCRLHLEQIAVIPDEKGYEEYFVLLKSIAQEEIAQKLKLDFNNPAINVKLGQLMICPVKGNGTKGCPNDHMVIVITYTTPKKPDKAYKSKVSLSNPGWIRRLNLESPGEVPEFQFKRSRVCLDGGRQYFVPQFMKTWIAERLAKQHKKPMPPIGSSANPRVVQESGTPAQIVAPQPSYPQQQSGIQFSDVRELLRDVLTATGQQNDQTLRQLTHVIEQVSGQHQLPQQGAVQAQEEVSPVRQYDRLNGADKEQIGELVSRLAEVEFSVPNGDLARVTTFSPQEIRAYMAHYQIPNYPPHIVELTQKLLVYESWRKQARSIWDENQRSRMPATPHRGQRYQQQTYRQPPPVGFWQKYPTWMYVAGGVLIIVSLAVFILSVTF